jgi:protein pelota
MDSLSIIKEEWKEHQLQRIDEAVKLRNQAFITFVSLDDDTSTIAVLRQSGVQWITDIDSRRSGKMFESKDTEHEYFGEIISVVKTNKTKDSILVIVGPGFTKEHLVKYGRENEPQIFEKSIVHGTGEPGMNGIQEAIKTGIIEQITKENRVVFETSLVEKLFEEIKKNGLATYGKDEVKTAILNGAVVRLLITDIMVRKDKGEELLRLAKQNNSDFTIINTMHEAGKKIEGIGGIAALLRFKI